MMRYTMAGLMLLLMTASAWAGTWSDDFESGNTDSWAVAHEGGATTFETVDGELNVEVQGEFATFIGLVNSSHWRDYTVTVKTKILEIFGSFANGGIYLYESFPNEQFYYFFVGDRWGPEDWKALIEASEGHIEAPYPGTPSEGQGVIIYPVVGEIQEGKSKVFAPELDRWYTLKAVAQGSSTEFYVDDELVGTFDFSELSSGGVGVVVTNARVRFDDFTVTGPGVSLGATPVEPQAKLAMTWARIKQGR